MKRLPYILVILFAIPFIASAALPGDATLTLNTRVNEVFLHGFFLLNHDTGTLNSEDILEKFIGTGALGDMDGTGEYRYAQNEEYSYEDYNGAGDFDFGEPTYEIGYYLFLSNVVGNYTVKFAISPFWSETTKYIVPWSLKVENAGNNTDFENQTKILSSGESLGFGTEPGATTSEVFQTGSEAVHKYAALKLTMLSPFGGEGGGNEVMVPAGTDYIATVVASITGP